MDKVLATLFIYLLNNLARSKPLNNEVSLKLNPIYVNDQTTTVLALIKYTDSATATKYKKEIIYETPVQNSGDFTDNSKHIAKVFFPNTPAARNATGKCEHFIKIPIVPQPFSDYKIIVVVAPWQMRIRRRDTRPVVVYFVFPEDNEDVDSGSVSIPEIYFVKKGTHDDIKNDMKMPPLILVNNNRTVTGLKSKEVAKFVKFKNKLISRDGLNEGR